MLDIGATNHKNENRFVGIDPVTGAFPPHVLTNVLQHNFGINNPIFAESYDLKSAFTFKNSAINNINSSNRIDSQININRQSYDNSVRVVHCFENNNNNKYICSFTSMDHYQTYDELIKYDYASSNFQFISLKNVIDSTAPSIQHVLPN